MIKEKIMTDMDDVITTGGFLRIINEFLGTNYSENDVNGYYQQDLIPSNLMKDFYTFFKTKNLYSYCDLSNGVRETLEDLNKEYDVYVGTSYIFKEIVNESGYILKDKFDFLVDNFPFLDPYKFIFIGDKSVLNMDIKIDDRLDNLVNTKRKILFTAYHNEKISDTKLESLGVERAKDWYDVKKKLLTR